MSAMETAHSRGTGERFSTTIESTATFLRAWWHQIAISGASVYLMTMYGQSHQILPPIVALFLSLGWEGVYIRGLAQSARVKRGFWAHALIYSCAATAVGWGILYIFGLPSVGIIPQKELGYFWGTITALAHVLPIAWTSIASAMLHRQEHRERAEVVDANAAAEAELTRELIAAKNDIEIEKVKAAARLELQALKRSLQSTVAESVAAQHNDKPSETLQGASERGKAEDRRAAIRNAVQRAHDANATFDRSALAAELGVNRTTIWRAMKDLGLVETKEQINGNQ